MAAEATGDVATGGGDFRFHETRRVRVVVVIGVAVGVVQVPFRGTVTAVGPHGVVAQGCAYGHHCGGAAIGSVKGSGAIAGAGDVGGRRVVAAVIVTITGGANPGHVDAQQQLGVEAVGGPDGI